MSNESQDEHIARLERERDEALAVITQVRGLALHYQNTRPHPVRWKHVQQICDAALAQQPADHPAAGEQAQGRATITWASAEDFDHIAGEQRQSRPRCTHAHLTKDRCPVCGPLDDDNRPVSDEAARDGERLDPYTQGYSDGYLEGFERGLWSATGIPSSPPPSAREATHDRALRRHG